MGFLKIKNVCEWKCIYYILVMVLVVLVVFLLYCGLR